MEDSTYTLQVGVAGTALNKLNKHQSHNEYIEKGTHYDSKKVYCQEMVDYKFALKSENDEEKNCRIRK